MCVVPAATAAVDVDLLLRAGEEEGGQAQRNVTVSCVPGICHCPIGWGVGWYLVQSLQNAWGGGRSCHPHFTKKTEAQGD